MTSTPNIISRKEPCGQVVSCCLETPLTNEYRGKADLQKWKFGLINTQGHFSIFIFITLDIQLTLTYDNYTLNY